MAWSAGLARAELITSRAALGGNGTIDWSQLGPDLTQISNPATVTSSGGSTSIVAQVSGNGQRRTQGPLGASWNGNFAPGDAVYYAQYAINNNDKGPITLSFASPVEGVGTQVQE